MAVSARERPPPDEVSPAVIGVHGALIADGLIEPLVLGGGEETTWLNFELGSLAENRMGDPTSPAHLDEARRAAWLRGATSEPLYAPSTRDLERCYWLLDRGERAGTVALAVDLLLDRSNIRLSSLYVLPAHRGHRLGRGIVLALAHRAAAIGLGMRLTTSWAWQRTVRLYAAMGFWVRMWKHDLDLLLDVRDPYPIVRIDGDEASLSIDRGGVLHVLVRATRRGSLLAIETNGDDGSELGLRARSTLALHLALAGWPLIRSARHFAEVSWADAGAPEALANRIRIWEAWDRAHGYRVETPRIPELDYPTWDELQASWTVGG